ncbi:glutaminase A [Bacillus sp. DTU_2020_1000418_1_SI_GHA_SEK_038]|uniref:glutaminase A n=1 Tax=Bacillus sp. DTU_2020_1000418_1_SI_GHA_SEK_038 TaxID=3077585 RepID=UPI0028E95230|nr:glutaminase A [Bacillus sp. DTU_2020_1000418_1_SI_GHA_SEK_038]WNS75462.1 glutaminase A [Bacillus sp. DTU_2020_1000418_1_SI_GHA_SEK_038]
MLEQITNEAKAYTKRGKPASYIPVLALQSVDQFAACIIDQNGNYFAAGNIEAQFTLQSISKVISFIVACEYHGLQFVLDKVDVEPTGDPFNSIIRLESTAPGKPFNPMINAGAITVASMLPGETVKDRIAYVADFLTSITGSPHQINEEVYRSEIETTHRNRAIAYYLKANDYLLCDVEEAVESYIHLCALEVSAKDLAQLGLMLAGDGVHPLTNKKIITPTTAKVTKALMTTCGLYNASGKYAASIGIPMKSGVSGGVLCTVSHVKVEQLEGKLGIGVYSPGIDDIGNSVAGMKFIEKLSQTYDLSIF